MGDGVAADHGKTTLIVAERQLDAAHVLSSRTNHQRIRFRVGMKCLHLDCNLHGRTTRIDDVSTNPEVCDRLTSRDRSQHVNSAAVGQPFHAKPSQDTHLSTAAVTT